MSQTLGYFNESDRTMTLCCMICGALRTIPVSENDDENDNIMMTLEHKIGCAVMLTQIKEIGN